MNTFARGAAPLTLVTVITLVESGVAANWWQIPIAPGAVAGIVVAIWISGVLALAHRGHPQPAIVAAASKPAARDMPAPSAIPSSPSTGGERRADPRYQVTHSARVDVRGLPSSHAIVHDISPGGPRIAKTSDLAPGTRGLLHVRGVALPVPFDVVSEPGSRDLRVKFELEGLGRTAFHRRLIRLLKTAGATAGRDKTG
jgi:hypothetical protein